MKGDEVMRKTISLLILLLVSLVVVPLQTQAMELSGESSHVIVKEYIGEEYIYKRISRQEYEEKTERHLASANASTRPFEFVQDDKKRYAQATKSLSWGTERIGATDYLDHLTNTSDEVVVAVIDTGVDARHSLLKDRMLPGYNFVEDNSNPNDTHGHGTHVAGIVTESTPDNVKIMPIRVLGDEAYGYDFDISKGIFYAVDHGAHIINLSLGGRGDSPYMTEAIEYAVGKDVLVIVSAGNEHDLTDYYFPASNEEAIVVSATDEEDDFADFSNYGRSVDIAAPGVGIVSAYPGDSYQSMNGTSMATPYVSGAAAVLKLENMALSNKEIEHLLLSYTDDLGTVGKDKYYGEGVLNMAHFMSPEDDITVMSAPQQLSTSNHLTVKVDVRHHVGHDMTIKVDGKLVAQEKIESDGIQVFTVLEEKLPSGTHEYTISVEKDGIVSFIESHTYEKATFNTSFYIHGMDEKLISDYQVHIYMWEKELDKANFSGSLFYDEVPLTGKVQMDVDPYMLEWYDFYAVVYPTSNLGNPIYVRQIEDVGDQIYKPNHIEKKVLQIDSASLNQDRELNPFVVPVVENSVLPRIPLYPQKNTNTVEFLLDSERFIMGAQGKDFLIYGDSTKDRWVFDDTNMMQVSYEGHDRSIAPELFDHGSYDELTFTVPEGKLENELANFRIKAGVHSVQVPIGDYKMKFEKYNTFDRVLSVYKNINEKNASEVHKYGNDRLTTHYEYDYDSDIVSGTAHLKDEFGNILADGIWSDVWSIFVVLKNVDTGEWHEIWVDDGKFDFNDAEISDGLYEISVDYENAFFPSDNKKEIVRIENNSFYKEDANQLPIIEGLPSHFEVKEGESLKLDLLDYVTDPDGDELTFSAKEGRVNGSIFTFKSDQVGEHHIDVFVSDGRGEVVLPIKIVVQKTDYTRFDKEINIALNKVWTITFNDIFKENEKITSIEVSNNGTNIPIQLEYKGAEKKVEIKSIEGYKPKTDYQILVQLKNGKKYMKQFTTK